jgi:hypothetical protein
MLRRRGAAQHLYTGTNASICMKAKRVCHHFNLLFFALQIFF